MKASKLDRLHKELGEARAQIRSLQQTISYERSMRVSAQRGLVSYMRNHGLGDRIGYDPDTDRVVQEAIAAGLIVPAGSLPLLKLKGDAEPQQGAKDTAHESQC